MSEWNHYYYCNNNNNFPFPPLFFFIRNRGNYISLFLFDHALDAQRWLSPLILICEINILPIGFKVPKRCKKQNIVEVKRQR